MKDLFSEALNLIYSGKKGALSTIISSKGSLPMSKKAKMLVLPDGKILGTVGGGCLEADVWAEARVVMETGKPTLQRFILTEKQAGENGLNCGGNVEIFTEPLFPKHGENILKEISEIQTERGSAVLATLVVGGSEAEWCSKLLVRPDGSMTGTLGYPEADAAVAREVQSEEPISECLLKVLEMKVTTENGLDMIKVFLESICPEPTLYLFGGGHVSFAIASIAQPIGFRVVVIDDRPTFANRERFPMATEVLTLDMETAFDHLEIDDLSYIIAVTRGHQHDKPVVEQAVKTKAAYIGMIGSRRKIKLMWKELEMRGVSRSCLEKVHAPIGLDIGADNPDEIAVSIVAELIKIRRNKGKPTHELRSLPSMSKN